VYARYFAMYASIETRSCNMRDSRCPSRYIRIRGQKTKRPEHLNKEK
jgi:hypothetical protein